MRRSWAIAAAVTVALAWAGVAFVAMSPHGSSVRVPVDTDQAGAKEVKSELHDLKGEVLGKGGTVRGDKVIGGVVKPQEKDFQYTPREVCVRMKLDYPEQYANLDCSKPEYDSPHSWNDWGD